MSEISVEIGERIQRARKRAHLNQTQLALAIDKTLRTIQNYESGDVEPTLSTLVNISEVLHVHPSQLMGEWATQIRINNMGDFIEVLYALTSRKEIHVSLEIDNDPSHKERTSSIRFQGYDDADGQENQKACFVMNELEETRLKYESGIITLEQYRSWLRIMKTILSEFELTEKYPCD